MCGNWLLLQGGGEEREMVCLPSGEGKAAHKCGGWTQALGDMRLSVLNQWNCKILVVYPMEVKCENTHKVSWHLSE